MKKEDSEFNILPKPNVFWFIWLILDLIELLYDYLEGNWTGVKHQIGDNNDGTITVITQVFFKGEIIHEWNETADKMYLSEIKSDHKLEGKEYIKEHKLTA